MNEKIIKNIIVFLFVAVCFSSCVSRRFYDNRDGAFEVRNNIAELEEKQCEATIENSELGNKIERSRELTKDIRYEVEGRTGDIEEFEKILRRIRERNRKTNKHNE